MKKAAIVEPQLTKRNLEPTANFNYVDWDHWSHTPPAAAYVTNSGSYLESYELERAVGWDVPDFHRRRNAGELLPATPWFRFTSKGDTVGDKSAYTSTTHTYQTPSGAFVPFTDWVLSEDVVKAMVPAMDDEFIKEAAAKIYSNGFDTLTFLAELPETVMMFKAMGKSLLNLRPRDLRIWKNLRRKNVTRGTHTDLRNITNVWLGARYGIRPLIADIIGLDKAIRNLNEARTRYSERAGYSYTDTIQTYNEYSSSLGTRGATISDMISVSLRGSVTADINVPAFQVNPLQAAWEIIPLSFVVDWFLNVGKTLNALSFSNLVKAYTASSGVKVHVERSFVTNIVSLSSPYISGGYEQTASAEADYEMRLPRQLQLTIPHIRVRMDGFKILDLLGLVSQRLPKLIN